MRSTGGGPAVLPLRREGIPKELKDRHQWVCWRLEGRKGGSTKVPYVPGSNRKASSSDPETWGPFEEAAAAYEAGRYAGVGFVFASDDPFCGADLDGCRDPETGEMEGWAKEIVTCIGGYAEVSPSGTGLHIFARGALPPDGNRRGPVEMYEEGRFFTVTGHALGASLLNGDRSEALARVHARYVAPPAPQPLVEPRTTGVPLEDDGVLELCRGAKNAEKFRRLFDGGDASAYGDDYSAADLALVSVMAAHTDDFDQLDRLFRRSALYRPEKWGRRADYRRRTIERALSGRVEAAPPRKAPAKVQSALDGIEGRLGSQSWGGRKGPARRKILLAIVAHARVYGTVIQRGVRVSISRRQLAERAGCALSTVEKHLREMRGGEAAGLVAYDNLDRPGPEAGALVLPFACGSSEREGVAGGGDCANSVQLPSPSRFPCASVDEGVPPLRSLRGGVARAKRLGPRAGEAFEKLLRAGGESTVREVRDMLGMRYPRDARRVLKALEEAGLVEMQGDAVRVLSGWEEALQAARRAGAEDEAGAAQRALHKKDRARRAREEDRNDLTSRRLSRATREHDEARATYRAARGAAARKGRALGEEQDQTHDGRAGDEGHTKSV